jgi:hypothetical protein
MISGDEYKTWSSSLCNFLYSPVIPPLLGPNNLLRTLFSNTLRLCSSLSVTDQVSHPHKTTGRIKFFCSLTVIFLDSRWEDKRIWQNGSKHSLNLVCSSSLHACNFDLLVLFQNIWTLSHLLRTYLPSSCYAFVLPSDNVTLTYI